MSFFEDSLCPFAPVQVGATENKIPEEYSDHSVSPMKLPEKLNLHRPYATSIDDTPKLSYIRSFLSPSSNCSHECRFSDNIQTLHNEILHARSKLNSMKHKLSLKKQENAFLHSTLSELETRAAELTAPPKCPRCALF